MQTEQPIFEENMFHPSLKSNTNTIEIEQDNLGNESVDLFSSFVTAPARPGMETLIQEPHFFANKKKAVPIQHRQWFHDYIYSEPVVPG